MRMPGSTKCPAIFADRKTGGRYEGHEAMLKNGMPPIHPGETLREDFLVPLGLSGSALAKELHVAAPSINEIVRERRGVSPLMALRLARHFGGTARWWINMQATYDLKIAEKQSAKQIEREVRPRRPATP